MLSCKETIWGCGDWEREKMNEKWILKPHWSDQGWGQRQLPELHPQRKYCKQSLKKGKAPVEVIPWASRSTGGLPEEASEDTLIRYGPRWAGGKPILWCSLSPSYIHSSCSALSWTLRVNNSLRSFDSRKKKSNRKFFHWKSGDRFSLELHFFIYWVHGKSKLSEWDLAAQVFNWHKKMLCFANRKGKPAALWSFQKSANGRLTDLR